MIANDKINELQDRGFCVLKARFSKSLIDASREAFWPILLDYLNTNREHPNRGSHRHYFPMPFDKPCFAPDFFFDTEVLKIVRSVMDERIVADQWGCDVPLRGSDYQEFHVDYQRPLFAEVPDLLLPPYMLTVSFGLVPITSADGPIQIAAGTHRLPRSEALRQLDAVER
jgi:hypothetical protein